MVIRVIREPSGPDTTFGVMFLNGIFLCFTLENSHKIIPNGTYGITLYNSPKNKMVVPLLENVMGRSMIEIHPANWFYELEGCIAVGEFHNGGTLYNSRTSFNKLMEHIKGADKLVIKMDGPYDNQVD